MGYLPKQRPVGITCALGNGTRRGLKEPEFSNAQRPPIRQLSFSLDLSPFPSPEEVAARAIDGTEHWIAEMARAHSTTI